MNSVVLVGNLVRNPELSHSGAGLAICKFTLALSRMKKDETDFINVVSFNKVAENSANYLSKGKKVAVEGRLQSGKYVNKEGVTVYTVDVIANTVEFLEPCSKKEDQQVPPEMPAFDMGSDDDVIPF